jgi:hypothetical protein
MLPGIKIELIFPKAQKQAAPFSHLNSMAIGFPERLFGQADPADEC